MPWELRTVRRPYKDPRTPDPSPCPFRVKDCVGPNSYLQCPQCKKATANVPVCDPVQGPVQAGVRRFESAGQVRRQYTVALTVTLDLEDRKMLLDCLETLADFADEQEDKHNDMLGTREADEHTEVKAAVFSQLRKALMAPKVTCG